MMGNSRLSTVFRELLAGEK